MTIIEKIYAGKELNESELEAIATGCSRFCNTEFGEYQEFDFVEGDTERWTQDVKTIIKVGDDLWCIPWQRGLTERQESEFYTQPYRVERKQRIEVFAYYEKLVEAPNKEIDGMEEFE